jgi:hypothetical protein
LTLTTVVHHVSEKTAPEFVVHMPDVHAVYQKILDVNADTYAIVLLPEYNAHDSWPAEAAWIIANFQDIPVMIDCAGGWEHHVTVEELQVLIAAGVDVQWIRIAELVSYYEEWLKLPFPDEYVLGLLEFCKVNGIKVYFCEWQIAAFDKVIELVGTDYADIVTIGLKTNSGDMEPAQGFKYVIEKIRAAELTHFGATVESWYWETRHRGESAHPDANVWNPDNMPTSWMVCHAQEAVSMPNVWFSGAELIQFEAYWWFFEHVTGEARDSLRVVHRFLNTHVAVEENSTVILETLMAEWIGGPAKAEVAWLDGRVSPVFGWDIQPSSFDFKNMPKKYAVTCYSLGSTSPNGKVWLKYETVAVEILVKVLGSTLDKASLIRERMRVEVERILYMYSRVGPLWDPGTGILHRRVIPGISDVVVSQVGNQVDDSNFARVTVQVKCKVFPKKSWVSKL